MTATFQPGPLSCVSRAEADRRGFRGFRFGVFVGFVVGALAGSGSQALAQYAPTPPLSRMTLAPGEDGCVAMVAIENRAGVYNATETLDVPGYGPVSIRYQTVGGHNAADDDRIEVTALPDGLTADPVDAPIRDGDTLAVCLLEYLGG